MFVKIVSNKKGIPIWSVSDISSAIAGTLIKTFGIVAVRGEIVNFSSSSLGHVYFGLKDESATIFAVCFAGIVRKININLENGMNVTIYGKLDCYESRSIYQIKVENIKFDGLGTMMLMLEERKNRLAKSGIFDQKHKNILPKLPQKIGIITSENGAVIHDILVKLEERFPVNVLIYNSLVQGHDAVRDIISGIDYFNKNTVDIIIIARGGGSFEDLFCFNDEDLIKNIFACKIPIISAVGHEVDYTLCDFVADFRAPTPTSVAEMIVPKKHDIIIAINNYHNLSTQYAMQQLNNAESFIENIFNVCTNFINLIFIKEKELNNCISKITLQINYTQAQVVKFNQDIKFILLQISRKINSLLHENHNMILVIQQSVNKVINYELNTKTIQINSILISKNMIQNKINFSINKQMWKIANTVNTIHKQYSQNILEISISNKNNIIENIDFHKKQILQTFENISQKINLQIQNKYYNLKQINGLIENYDHNKILNKGYVIIKNTKTGKILSKLNLFDDKTNIQILMQDGVGYFVMIKTKIRSGIYTLLIFILFIVNFII